MDFTVELSENLENETYYKISDKLRTFIENDAMTNRLSAGWWGAPCTWTSNVTTYDVFIIHEIRMWFQFIKNLNILTITPKFGALVHNKIIYPQAYSLNVDAGYLGYHPESMEITFKYYDKP